MEQKIDTPDQAFKVMVAVMQNLKFGNALTKKDRKYWSECIKESIEVLSSEFPAVNVKKLLDSGKVVTKFDLEHYAKIGEML